MKKDLICKLLYVISIILVIAFSVLLTLDYFKYDVLYNSAPFSAIVIVRLLEFILPSIICLFLAILIKKRK